MFRPKFISTAPVIALALLACSEAEDPATRPPQETELLPTPATITLKTLSLAAASSQPGDIQLAELEGPGRAAPASFVAYRQGLDVWTPLSSTDGHYSFEVKTRRYSVAVVCGALDGAAQVRVFELTADDVTALEVSCFEPLDEQQQRALVIDHRPDNTCFARVAVGPVSTPFVNVSEGALVESSFIARADDVLDVVTIARCPRGSGQPGDEDLTAKVATTNFASDRRYDAIGAGGTVLPIIDDNLADNDRSSYAAWVSEHGTIVGLDLDTRRYAMAEALRGTHDLYALEVFGDGGSITRLSRELADQPALDPPAPGADVRYSVKDGAIELPALDAELYFVHAGHPEVEWTVVVSSAWLDDGRSARVPDFSAMPNFDPRWSLATFDGPLRAFKSNRDRAAILRYLEPPLWRPAIDDDGFELTRFARRD